MVMIAGPTKAVNLLPEEVDTIHLCRLAVIITTRDDKLPRNFYFKTEKEANRFFKDATERLKS
jgi:hypothetical protein